MLVLAMKVVLAPALVVGATLAGRRWGAVIAGLVIAIPIVAGPILAILTIEHGRAFGAAAARGALLGVVALSAFCAVFVRAALAGRRWPRALLAGWAAYGVVAAIAAQLDVASGWALILALAALAAAYGAIRPGDPVGRPDVPAPAWDLPARAATTAVLVITLTAAAGALGPAASGVLTPFPVATSVIAAFTLHQDGPLAVRALVQGFVRWLPGFALCFFVAAVVL